MRERMMACEGEDDGDDEGEDDGDDEGEDDGM